MSVSTVTVRRPSAVLRRIRRVDRADAAVVGGVTALAMLVLWAMHDALIDDAYITLGYARTLAEHGEWGLIPGTPANTATSVMNVVALAAVTVVLRDPLAALWVVTAATAALLGWGLLRLGRSWGVGRSMAIVAAPLILLNPMLASALGMETLMAVTALVWLLERARAGRTAGFGWLSGATVLIRPDLVVVVAVVWLLHPALRRPRWFRGTWAVGWRAAAVSLPWFAFSWLYFGTAIPDTLALKQHQTWGDFATGWWQRYHPHYADAVEVVALIAALGLAAALLAPLLARRERGPLHSVAAAPLAGAAYFGLIWLLDVPPYFWYYGLPVAALTLALGWVVGVLASLRATGMPRLGTTAVAAALVLAAVTPTAYVWGDHVRDHAPLREAPVHGNWALPWQYKQIGLDLRERFADQEDVVIRSSGEFGTVLYYCECRLVDRFSDRSLVLPFLERHEDTSWAMRLNYVWFDADDYPPVQQDFHLQYERWHVETGKPHVWNVFSPNRGPGHYSLAPGGRSAGRPAGVTPS